MCIQMLIFSVPNDCLWYDKLWGPSQRVVTLFIFGIGLWMWLFRASQTNHKWCKNNFVNSARRDQIVSVGSKCYYGFKGWLSFFIHFVLLIILASNNRSWYSDMMIFTDSINQWRQCCTGWAGGAGQPSFQVQPDAVNINKMILAMTWLIIATTVSKTVSGPTQPTRGAVRWKRRVAIPRLGQFL